MKTVFSHSMVRGGINRFHIFHLLAPSIWPLLVSGAVFSAITNVLVVIHWLRGDWAVPVGSTIHSLWGDLVGFGLLGLFGLTAFLLAAPLLHLFCRVGRALLASPRLLLLVLILGYVLSYYATIVIVLTNDAAGWCFITLAFLSVPFAILEISGWRGLDTFIPLLRKTALYTVLGANVLFLASFLVAGAGDTWFDGYPLAMVVWPARGFQEALGGSIPLILASLLDALPS